MVYIQVFCCGCCCSSKPLVKGGGGGGGVWGDQPILFGNIDFELAVGQLGPSSGLMRKVRSNNHPNLCILIFGSFIMIKLPNINIF